MISKTRDILSERRILIFTPTGRDAVLTARFLADAGLATEICASAAKLVEQIKENAGLVFLTGEALTPETASVLIGALRSQPPWSDIPLIVLTSGGGESPSNAAILAALGEAGNVTLVERPVRLMTLISAVKSALRARRRQYEARDLLIAESEAKEALRRSEADFRQLADSLPQFVWVTSAINGALVYVNEKWAEFSGLSLEETNDGERLAQIIHPDDRKKMFNEWTRAFGTGSRFEIEVRFKEKDAGEYRWFLTRSNPIRSEQDGRILKWFGTSTDITRRKSDEAERERLLQQEQSARAEAEAANRLKDEFLATVSHELRTPLNAMLGWTSLLRSGRLKGEAAERALATVERNARTQAEIIEDLLDVSRIITGKLKLQITVFEPVRLVEAVVESLQPAADAKQIDVRLAAHDAENARMKGDEARIRQILWNLLSNAIKFTPPGGSVDIDLRRETAHLIIRITDSGSGISAEFLPYVFDRFLQADGSTTRHHGGLGLGLAIVRHLVDLHGGAVRAASDGEGRGATFTVELPLSPDVKSVRTDAADDETASAADASKSGRGGAPDDDLNGLKILVVDDDADSLELVKTFLERSGARVAAAQSMSEALALLKKMPALDLLVSDIGMPEADGYELISRVRALPSERGGSVPAIALTAYARTEDKIKAAESGFQQHLSKPIECDELIAAVSRLARSKS